MPLSKLNTLSSLKAACSTCTLRELCLPMGLAQTDLEKLDRVINRRQRIRAGQHVYRAGGPFNFLYAIRVGFFKSYEVNKDGQEQVTGFHMAGEIMGLDAISTEKHTCSAMALDDGEVCEIPFAGLEDLTRQVPALQHQFHKILSREIAADHQVMLLLGAMSAEQRVAAFLLNLSRRIEALGYSPTILYLRMSREEIGNYLGLKLETVSRAFSKLQNDGLIAVDRRNLTIKNTAALTGLIGLDGCKRS